MQAQMYQIENARKAFYTLKPVQEMITKCRPSWAESWSVSLFSDAKFAAYKTEPQVRRFVEDGSWSSAYLGEYDASSEKLTLYPSDPEKTRTSPSS